MPDCSIQVACQTASFKGLRVQVGEVEADRLLCMRAELDVSTPRTDFYTQLPSKPGSDLLFQAAAAFAAASIALKGVRSYSINLLAQATEHRGIWRAYAFRAVCTCTGHSCVWQGFGAGTAVMTV
jgi:hypothetical protein